MKFIKSHKILFVALAIILVLVILFVVIFWDKITGSLKTAVVASTLPDITYFRDHPTDYFLLKDVDFTKYILSTSPFSGPASMCAHTGGHINFTPNEAPYEVKIITPVDGVISNINSCFDLGNNDKFDISIAFAQYKGHEVTLDYSIEPFAGVLCRDNSDFYKKYIWVTEGQQVKAGDVIGIMPKFTSDPQSGTHIHFNLSTNGKMVCPNIFSQRLVTEFAQKYMQGGCNMHTFTEPTFCYLPGEGEDIVNSN